MPDQPTIEQRLTALRDLVASARSMPMSASCVVNRSELLELIDDIQAALPGELAAARDVIGSQQAALADGEARAARIVGEAREQALRQAGHSEQVQVAEERAARILADAEEEAEALRREVDLFIDSRMAGFESVLAKTSSQLRTARRRLAERSGAAGDGPPQRSVDLPSLD